ncbi:MAG: hypothetical protein AAF533_25600 [Acidobacteriota bacterium]
MSTEGVSLGRVLRLWWPLAASWILMSCELPLFTMAVARLPEAKVNLAAQGGLVFPVALLVEAPIIMLLAASTALCRDRASYRLVHRFMMIAGLVLTALHALVAFTPLHDFLCRNLIGLPEEVVEPARLGVRVMLPWTWSIAYRRFHQGLLIRAGQSRPVAVGTIVRLAANAVVLTLGVWHGGFSGILIGGAGIATAVIAEAVFIGWKARPVVRELEAIEPGGEALTLPGFLSFYVPLGLTQLLSLVLPPISAAAVSRMPLELPSLAAWPAAWGFVFITRSVSYAYNEVVVRLMDEPGATEALRRFAFLLAGGASAFLLVFLLTPLSSLWFATILELPPDLVALCRVAVAVAFFQPALAAMEMWSQGRLVHARRTKLVTGGMAIHLTAAVVVYAVGIAWSPWPGIHFAMVALSVAGACKVAWLTWWASRLPAAS